MSDAKPAARLLDQISHTSALAGFLGGAILGAVVGVAIVAATVATGGAALAVVAAVGAGVAATGGTALLGGALGATFMGPPCGTISPPCAVNVFVNNRPAARSVLDGVLCAMHAPGPPKPIATGAERVHINMMPAARVDETSVCGAKISQGSENVRYGGASVQMLDIQPEIPAWMTTTAQVMAIGGSIVAVGAGAAAAFMAGGTCALIGFAGETIGGLALGYVGKEAGGTVGEQIGGERGRIIGEATGEWIGGFFGGRLGGRMSRGHPVDVATGELFTTSVDFTLPGPLPFAFSRAWMSSSTETGASGNLGAKWADVLGQRLLYSPALDAFALRLEDGRLALFHVPEPGRPSVNTVERLILETDGSRFSVRDYNGISRHFAPDPYTAGGYLLSGFSDRNNNRISIERDRLGLLTQMTGSAGHVVGFHHDSYGRLVALDAPHPTIEGERFALMRYGYDAAGNLAHATDAEGNAIRYAYHAGQMVSETRKGGLHYVFEWDASFTRVTRTWGRSASGAMDLLNHAAFTYDELHRCSVVADADGHETRYFHDGAGHVTLEVDPLGRERRMSYDKAGNLLRTEEPTGAAVENAYDDMGRLVKGTTEKGAVFTQTMLDVPPTDIRFGLVASTTDSHHGPTSYSYDEIGNCMAETDATGAETRFLRDEHGRRLATLDAKGPLWRGRYSAGGLLVAEGPDALERFYERDRLGRVVRERYSDGRELRITLDLLGQPLEIDEGAGRITRMEHDPDGNIVRHITAEGAETRLSYDGIRHPVRRVEPTGATTVYTYDSEFRPLTVTNAEGEVYRLEYDAAGDLLRQVAFDGRETLLELSPETGALVAWTEGGRRTEQTADVWGRPLQRRHDDGSFHRFSWAANGQVEKAVSPGVVVGFSYDAAGRVVDETINGDTTTRRYDLRGRVEALLLPDGREITHDYADDGSPAALALDGRELARFSHDPLGRLKGIAAGAVHLRHSYDAGGRLAEREVLHHSGSGSFRQLLRRDYGWTAEDTLAELTDSRFGTRTYSYDAAQRLTAIQGWSPEHFAYDQANHLIAATTPESPTTSLAIRQNAGQVRVMGDHHFSYDAEGNMVEDWSGARQNTRRTYTYDGAGRLSEARITTWESEVTASYTYDAFNRRISKTLRTHRDSANDGAGADSIQTTRFYWCGDDMIGESTAVGAGAEAEADITPCQRLYIYHPGKFVPLFLVENGAHYLYDTDHLGTPQALFDAKGGMVWSAQYRAYGRAQVMEPGGLSQPLRAPGQYHDPETGLHYNRNRYLHPELGRYTQPDPIGLLGGENLYGYPTNPTGAIDFFGLTPLDQGGYSLYHITNGAGDVVYVGITNDPAVRRSGHTGTGRLGRGYQMNVVERNLTYAQARGYEQADIRHYGTRDTSRIGQPYQAGDPNRVWSYAEGRNDARAQAFQEHERQRTAGYGGCG
ncbi:hypothetical protein FHY55_19180 [Oceanicola sp. D3]|uniref:RHS repeat-associated core domain-containing protein n=1 Tax=Oceanicola sp. D3 TaxID=2587163 RepID=UPI001122EA20|nr:RHS repeat-associated core domain-containing protein [Oceanicola sp. D3]QDC11224.1 hypothetical protein FHY55_19180 [Oceanicola sp. D3]